MLVLCPYFSSLYIITTLFKPYFVLLNVCRPCQQALQKSGNAISINSHQPSPLFHTLESVLRRQNCVSGKVPTKYSTSSTISHCQNTQCPQINDFRIDSSKGWATFEFSEDARHFWRGNYGIFWFARRQHEKPAKN